MTSSIEKHQSKDLGGLKSSRMIATILSIKIPLNPERTFAEFGKKEEMNSYA